MGISRNLKANHSNDIGAAEHLKKSKELDYMLPNFSASVVLSENDPVHWASLINVVLPGKFQHSDHVI